MVAEGAEIDNDNRDAMLFTLFTDPALFPLSPYFSVLHC